MFGAATPERIALVGRDLHRAPADRALAGRPRGSRAARASTCRSRISPATAARSTISPRRASASGCAACSRSRPGAPTRCSAQGEPLVASLHGWQRFAVAGYLGGGRAALGAIARADYEVLALSPRPTRRRIAGAIVRVLAAGRATHERRRAAALRGDHARAGGELLLRDAPAAAGRSARRCSRSTPSRAASTTSATARSPVERKRGAARRRGRAARRAARRRPRAGRAGRRRASASRSREQSLRDLIDGVRMDVVGTDLRDASTSSSSTAGASPARSGGSASRCSAADDPRAGELADDLGVALQLTNILRDVREDAERGRTYLPAEDLERFGAPSAGDDRRRSSPSRRARAREWYARGLELIAAARPPQRRLRARDERHLPAPARPHRGRPAGDPRAARVARHRGPRSASPRAACWAGAADERRRRRRRRRRDRRGARLRRRRRLGDARRGAPAARRRRLLGRARRPLARQRPARVPALLHRLPRAARDARQRVAGRAAAAARDPGARARAGRRRCCAAAARARRCTSRARCCATPICRCASGSAPAAPRSRSAAPRPTTRARSATGCASTARAPHAIAALWDLIALPTLNLRAAEASLALGAFVFQEGLLSDAAAGDVGLHRAPLQQIIGDPAARALARAGVTVHLRWRAERITTIGSRFAVVGAGRLARRRRRDRRGPPRPRRGAAARRRRCAARAGPGRSAARRSSTCTSSTTAACSSSASPPASTRRCSTCSTARRPTGRERQYVAVSLSGARRRARR